MMPRIVARLDCRAGHVIKGIRYEGRRIVGDPHDMAVRYYDQGADEIYLVDAMAAMTGMNAIHDVISATADDVFVPLLVSGGIRSLDDVRAVLRAGADRVCVNTAAVADPSLVSRIAETFGVSTVAVAIDCARRDTGWEVMTEYGREATGLDAIEWAHRAQGLGAGEVVMTSIDQDGTRSGIDVSLAEALDLLIPVTLGGGARSGADALSALQSGADAVSIATILHYSVQTIDEVKDAIEAGGIRCRR